MSCKCEYCWFDIKGKVNIVKFPEYPDVYFNVCNECYNLDYCFKDLKFRAERFQYWENKQKEPEPKPEPKQRKLF